MSSQIIYGEDGDLLIIGLFALSRIYFIAIWQFPPENEIYFLVAYIHNAHVCFVKCVIVYTFRLFTMVAVGTSTGDHILSSTLNHFLITWQSTWNRRTVSYFKAAP